MEHVSRFEMIFEIKTISYNSIFSTEIFNFLHRNIFMYWRNFPSLLIGFFLFLKMIKEPLLMEIAAGPDEKISTKISENWRKRLGFVEDTYGLFIGLILYFFALIMAACSAQFTRIMQNNLWNLGGLAIVLFIVISMHFCLGKFQLIREYCMITFLAVLSREIGTFGAMKEIGLTPPFWCVFIGFLFSFTRMMNQQSEHWSKTLSAECFIKIGVILLAMNWTSLSQVGLRGLVVAWIDTIIVVFIGVWIGMKIFKLEFDQSMIVSGATSICGSSAATSISTALQMPESDPSAKIIIALM
jgi:uncharacterized membrane protein YadS